MVGGLVIIFFCLLKLQVSVGREYWCPYAKEGLPMDGPCGQKCICLDGVLQYCCRQRKNFASMTRAERLLYVNTVIKASTDRRYRRQYNRLIGLHKRLFNRGIHDREEFLPWHRWFLLRFENLLQRIDCRVTLPYWDWSLFPGAAWREGKDDIWSSKRWGLGGNGGRDRRGRAKCVKSGRFGWRRKWRVTPSGGGNCLKRAFYAYPPDIIAVYLTERFSPRRFNDFELELRANLHDTVHCQVGGTMCDHNSANAPEFFLHHCFIDKIWADWQEKSRNRLNAYYRRLPRGKRMLGTGHHPEEFLDMLELPNPDRSRFGRNTICVVYKDPVHPVYDEIMGRLDALTTRQIRMIPRRFFQHATSRQLKLLGVRKKERRRSRRLLKKVEPKHRIRGNRQLQSMIDKWLGFKLDAIPFTEIKNRRIGSSDLRQARWLGTAVNSTRRSTRVGSTFRLHNVSSTTKV